MSDISVADVAGDFAENKDAARKLREERVRPPLLKGQEVVLDFEGVGLATQSFIHALLSDLIRTLGPDVLDLLAFRNCNANIEGLISIVIEYSQDSTVEPAT